MGLPKGYKFSAATRRKMSESAKKRCAKAFIQKLPTKLIRQWDAADGKANGHSATVSFLRAKADECRNTMQAIHQVIGLLEK